MVLEGGALPYRLDEADTAYYNQLFSEYSAAEASWKSFLRFLAMKYKLVEGDTVQLAGDIVRRPVPLEEAATVGPPLNALPNGKAAKSGAKEPAA